MSFRVSAGFRSTLAVLSLIGAACSSSSTDDGGNNDGNGACSIKLTGAVTATYACTLPAAAAYTPGTGMSAVAFAYAPGSTANGVAVSIAFSGQVTKTSHSSSASDVSGGITVTNAGTSYFAVTGGGATTGSFTLTITSVSTLATTSSGTAYTVHGTLTGTLPPTVSGGTSVTINATF